MKILKFLKSIFFMRQKLFLSFAILFVLLMFFPQKSKAQQTQLPALKQEFYKAKVVHITEEGEKISNGNKSLYQDFEIEILDGNEKGKKTQIQSGEETTISADQKVVLGETIIVVKETRGTQTKYRLYEKYRNNAIIALAVVFFLLTVAVAGKKGLGSMVGLSISLAVILLFIIPQIMAGNDPIAISLYGSLVILFLTTYLAHGVSKQTTIALFSTCLALLLTSWISTLSVELAQLTGINEETSLLQFSSANPINLKGLLLAGIIIGTLGALNDITTTQAAAVFELAKTDRKLSIARLFQKGFGIGREHIASMINTLVLAYAGSSLIIFIFLFLNPLKVPYWVIINNELISSEIVRTIAGSMGLMLVVPISTFFAAFAAKKWTSEESVQNPKKARQ